MLCQQPGWFDGLRSVLFLVRPWFDFRHQHVGWSVIRVTSSKPRVRSVNRFYLREREKLTDIQTDGGGEIYTYREGERQRAEMGVGWGWGLGIMTSDGGRYLISCYKIIRRKYLEIQISRYTFFDEDSLCIMLINRCCSDFCCHVETTS